jgi:ankyrin repeat protein
MKSNQKDLFAACKAGSIQDVELILQSQPKDIVNSNSNDLREDSPLTLSASIGNIELCKLLIAKGANVNYKMKDLGFTPLWMALFCAENFQICELLLENGADIDSTIGSDHSPLIFATFLSSNEKIAFLIQKGADLHSKNYLGISPLMMMLSDIKKFEDVLLLPIIVKNSLTVAEDISTMNFIDKIKLQASISETKGYLNIIKQRVEEEKQLILNSSKK